MKTTTLSLLMALTASTLHAALPTDEAGAIAYLTEKGVTITKNAEGHAASLKAPGKPALTAEEYALIGQLTSLEQMGINGAPLADGEWGFLKSLPKLKQLAIWHSAGFGSLEPFSGLPVESLTIGGCMGLRDLNRSAKTKLRNALTTLHDLPNLTKGNWYHSPLVPDDTHLAHIAAQFPKLTDLRLDFAAPAMPMTGTPGKPGAGGAGGPFQQRDTNHDGKLTRDELPAALFERLDADKNGFVSEAELTALRKQK
jgi:hypothetical protein